MSLYIDLIVPSFALPLGDNDYFPSPSARGAYLVAENVMKEVMTRCTKEFGVGSEEIELFQMHTLGEPRGDIRLGCFIHGSGLNMDVITHTITQNKNLNHLLNKTADAVLHFQQQRDRDVARLMQLTTELAELKVNHKDLQMSNKELLLEMKVLREGGSPTQSKASKGGAATDGEPSSGTQALSPSPSLSNIPAQPNTKFLDRLANSVSENFSDGEGGNLYTANGSNEDIVGEGLRKHLITFTKDGPYFSYGNGVTPTPPRPKSGSSSRNPDPTN